MVRRLFAVLVAVGALMSAGCQTTPVQDGILAGGALGAGLGAIIGHQSGHAGEGALIGAGAGALTGALIGDQVDRRREQRVETVEVRYVTPGEVRRVKPVRVHGHYETRIVTTPHHETYEERVWVPHY